MSFMRAIAIVIICFLGSFISNIVTSEWQYLVGFITCAVAIVISNLFED